MKTLLLLVSLLVVAKKINCEIIYDIPTYPYFAEQFFGAPNKLKTAIRLISEILM
jgi:hypothetical protein